MNKPLNRTAALIVVTLIAQVWTLSAHAQSDAGPSPAVDDVDGPPSLMQRGTLTRDGVQVDFTLRPSAPAHSGAALQEGDLAEIAFRITSAESGEPLRNAYPGVWIDIAKAWQATDRSPAQWLDLYALTPGRPS